MAKSIKPKLKAKPKSALMLRVMAKFGDVRFLEGHIPAEKPNGVILGVWFNDDTIIINPIPQITNTVIHEILHSLFPAYTEQAIRSLTGKLWKQLSEDEMIALYEEYKKRVQLSDQLQKIEDDKQ